MTMTATPVRSQNRAAHIDSKTRSPMGVNLTPSINNASNMVLLNADDSGASATTPLVAKSSEKEQYTTPQSSSKRRRLSDEENKGGGGKNGLALPRQKLLNRFDSQIQSRKHGREEEEDTDTDIDSDDDEDGGVAEEEDHNNHCATLLRSIKRMNSMEKRMEGSDELVHATRASLYELLPPEFAEPRSDENSSASTSGSINKGSRWVKRGVGRCKFLRDLDEGFHRDTIYMIMHHEGTLTKLFSHSIDEAVVATPLESSSGSKKPSYVWRANTFEGWQRTLALKFASSEEAMKWKDTFERCKRETLAARMAQTGADTTDTSAGDEMAEHMKSLSTGGDMSHPPGILLKRKTSLKKKSRV